MKHLNLMSLKEVIEKKAELTQRFKELKDDRSQLMSLLSITNEITDWKFAKDQFAAYPVPYVVERWGHKTSSLLKKTYPSIEEGSNQNRYSFGFKDGLHKITLSPVTGVPKFTVNIFAYKKNTVSRTNIQLSPAKYKQNNIILDNPEVRLEVVEDFITMTPNSKLSMSFNSRGDFIAHAYEFDDHGKLISATFSHEGNDEGAEYTLNYHYNDKNELYKVSSPDDGFIAWEKNK